MSNIYPSLRFYLYLLPWVLLVLVVPSFARTIPTSSTTQLLFQWSFNNAVSGRVLLHFYLTVSWFPCFAPFCSYRRCRCQLVSTSLLLSSRWMIQQTIPLGHLLTIWWRLFWVELHGRHSLVPMPPTLILRSLSPLVSSKSTHLSLWIDRARTNRFPIGSSRNRCKW